MKEYTVHSSAFLKREDARFSSESVAPGHPDLVCDQIANGILDRAIELGGRPHVAVEVLATGDNGDSRGTLIISAEMSLPAGKTLDYETIARKTIQEIGYVDPDYGFYDHLNNLQVYVKEQSQEINHGVAGGKKTGAGDQGIIVGGAIDDGPGYMPFPIVVARGLTSRITELFQSGELPYLRPDAKSVVTVNYARGKATSIDNIVLAISHDSHVDVEQVRADAQRQIIEPVLDSFSLSLDPLGRITINGADAWTRFGPAADTGITNRKPEVHSYGAFFPHGGGGYNGKDPTKVDLSGAMAARYVARALVENGLAGQVQINIDYAIGNPDPGNVEIYTFGTEKVPLAVIAEKAQKALDFSVDGIIEGLKLFQPIYQRAAREGYYGGNDFPWEKIPSL